MLSIRFDTIFVCQWRITMISTISRTAAIVQLKTEIKRERRDFLILSAIIKS
jgi:hypothetical protein